MYSIIIADIAPRMPGNLMHFNLPRLLRYAFGIQGLFTSPLIIGLMEIALIDKWECTLLGFSLRDERKSKPDRHGKLRRNHHIKI